MVTARWEFAVPTKLTLSGFGLFMLQVETNGRAGELINLAKINFVRRASF
jgi:hypothetical protein